MLLRRLFATTTGAIVSKGAAIVTALLLFRQLPAAEMGRYTAVLTLVGFCSILGNAGLNPLTTREIARRGESGWDWWASVAPLRLLLALGAYGLLAGIALFVPALVDARLALVTGLLLIPDALSGALAATLGGIGHAALASWLDALSKLIGLLATLALVLIFHPNIFDLAWLAVALAVWTLLLNGLALLRHWRSPWRTTREWLNTCSGSAKIRPIWTHGHARPRQGGQIRRPPWTMLRQLPSRLYTDWKYALVAALPLGLGALAATLYFRVDTLFLSAARGGRAVAYYSAPYQIVESFWLISTSWNAAMLPALARRYSPRTIEHSIALLLSIGLPASLVITFRAEDIVTLVFGSAYLPAVLPLQLVIWVVPILFSYVPLVTALFVHDRQRDVLYVLLTNLVLALLLDAMLIPPYGVVGASIATLVVEFVGLIGYICMARYANLEIIWTRGLVGPLLICVPLAFILVIGQALPFFFIMPAVLMLWSALFALLGPWAGGPVNPLFFSPQGARSLHTRPGTEPPEPAGNGRAGTPADTNPPMSANHTTAHTSQTTSQTASPSQAASQGTVVP